MPIFYSLPVNYEDPKNIVLYFIVAKAKPLAYFYCKSRYMPPFMFVKHKKG